MADPQNGYGVKEEVEKKDNRANYAYVNFMKNKLRAGMGIKNPMIMVDPDEAEKKFEKVATSTKATPDDEDEKEGACESVDQKMSDISKNIMEKGKFISHRDRVKKDMIKDQPSTNIPTESNPDGGIRNPDDPTSYPSGAEIKPDKPVKDKKPAPMMNSYDPLSNKEILGISEKILKKNFNLGEEGYDIARDEGRVKPSKDKKDGTSYPPSEEMKKTRKVNKGPSAFEIVKKKYGKAVMDVDKKKKDKK